MSGHIQASPHEVQHTALLTCLKGERGVPYIPPSSLDFLSCVCISEVRATLGGAKVEFSVRHSEVFTYSCSEGS